MKNSIEGLKILEKGELITKDYNIDKNQSILRPIPIKKNIISNKRYFSGATYNQNYFQRNRLSNANLNSAFHENFAPFDTFDRNIYQYNNNNFNQQSYKNIVIINYINPKRTPNRKVKSNIKEDKILFSENDIIEEENMNIFSAEPLSDVFEIKKTEKPQNNKFKISLGRKRRGRKPHKESKREHKAEAQDNIIRKIQVHFLSFIISFCNEIINTIFPERKDLNFKNINYSEKKIVKHSRLESLKKMKISEILQLDISPKNKRFSSNINKINYDKVCIMSDFLKNFFEISYLDMFNNYYYNRKERIINIGEYQVHLSERTKLFSDLIEKNKSSEKKIREIAEQFYVLKKHDFNKISFVINKEKVE